MIFYEYVKDWQHLIGSALGSIFGFGALICGANRKFKLDRKRDDELREEERKSVLAALYGEILFIRNQACHLVNIISKTDLSNEDDRLSVAAYLKAYQLSEPIMYKQLAGKIGLINPELVIKISEFYGNCEESRRRITEFSEIGEKTRSPCIYILRPCYDTVYDFEATLREIERSLNLRASQEVDLSDAKNLLDNPEKYTEY